MRISDWSSDVCSSDLAGSIIAFARALPQTTLLVLDEAYCETAPEGSTPAIDALLDMPNVVRTRTFSKAYGLAGARIGHVIPTPGQAAAFDQARNHNGLARTRTARGRAALTARATPSTGPGP